MPEVALVEIAEMRIHRVVVEVDVFVGVASREPCVLHADRAVMNFGRQLPFLRLQHPVVAIVGDGADDFFLGNDGLARISGSARTSPAKRPGLKPLRDNARHNSSARRRRLRPRSLDSRIRCCAAARPRKASCHARADRPTIPCSKRDVARLCRSAGKASKSIISPRYRPDERNCRRLSAEKRPRLGIVQKI